MRSVTTGLDGQLMDASVPAIVLVDCREHQPLARKEATVMTTPTTQAKRAAPKAPEVKAPEAKAAEAKAAEAKTAGLDSEFLASPVILASVEPELLKATAPRNNRSDEQKSIDTVVANLHSAWVKAGKLTQWSAMVNSKCVATYFVEPAQAAKFKQYVNRAGDLHSRRIKYGTPIPVTEAIVKRYGLPDNYLGREIVSFAVMDKKVVTVDPEVRKAALAKAAKTRAANKAAAAK